ncbi:MAG: hypothetical protein JWM11_900, partial [Planctomycetaceae bacterium]|nr:hypothetical protein [Planctomycetaceae bacterium]
MNQEQQNCCESTRNNCRRSHSVTRSRSVSRSGRHCDVSATWQITSLSVAKVAKPWELRVATESTVSSSGEIGYENLARRCSEEFPSCEFQATKVIQPWEMRAVTESTAPISGEIGYRIALTVFAVLLSIFLLTGC